MPSTEHILLESDDRTVPERRTARKVHAHLQFRTRVRRRAFVLDIIDYYFLSVRISRAPVAEYVLDLRFVDPVLIESRHIAWRWLTATLAFAGLFTAAVWWARAPLAPWWQHHALAVCATLFALTTGAAVVSVYRTTESLLIRSIHGQALLLECTGGLGTRRALRAFTTKLAAHIQIAAGARRSTKAEHLRDEMREHFRLKEAGVLADEAYEASKLRILSTHGPAPAPALRQQVAHPGHAHQ